MNFINKIGIIGVGLLGGSIGLSCKKIFPNVIVSGMDIDEDSLQKALSCNAIDQYHLDIKEGVEECDLIIICTPVNTISKIVLTILPFLKDDAVITDVGSTKKTIVEKIAKENESSLNYFIGSHPMTGSEQCGIEFANDTLLNNSLVIVIENDIISKHKIEFVIQFWEKLGAKIKLMTADNHDQLIGYTSHLPHIIASSLSYTLANNLSQNDLSNKIYGNGLLDTTRIAQGHPKIWLDIIENNRDNLLESIKIYMKNINQFYDLIEQNDSKGIYHFLNKGKNFRENLKI